MKKILFFDTETTGLSSTAKLVQISWILYHGEARMESGNFLIKPEGFEIPKEATAIHGHTTEKCLKEGKDLRLTLRKFYRASIDSDLLVGHNVDFDIRIIKQELVNVEATFAAAKIGEMQKVCTMKKSTNYCKLPSSRGYKWPKLGELYKILFGREMVNAHDALYDVNCTAECYFELVKIGVI